MKPVIITKEQYTLLYRVAEKARLKHHRLWPVINATLAKITPDQTVDANTLRLRNGNIPLIENIIYVLNPTRNPEELRNYMYGENETLAYFAACNQNCPEELTLEYTLINGHMFTPDPDNPPPDYIPYYCSLTTPACRNTVCCKQCGTHTKPHQNCILR